MSDTPKAPPDPAPELDTGGLGGHPRALTTLFFIELWERFSFYGMKGLLILYMTAALTDGGLAYDQRVAAWVYGIYSMSVYLLSIPGGLVADRWLGGRKAVLVGGSIIAAGHFCMAAISAWSFYAGLALIVFGTGLLKPNISAMMGELYSDKDARRDAGFSVFYMGINIGAALAPLVCGFLAQSSWFKAVLSQCGFDPVHSWHWAFGAAGVGMLLGLLQYALQRDRLALVGRKPERSLEAGAVAAKPLTGDDWRRMAAVAVLFFFSALFWSVYEQGGSSLNLFARDKTDTTIFGWHFESSWFQALGPIFVILLVPLYNRMWRQLGDRQPSSPLKFAIGLALLGAGVAIMVPAALLTASGLVSPWWLFFVYLVEVLGELCLSPVGLSTVTKLAPPRFVGLMTGVWFLAAALGNFAAGYIASFYDAGDPVYLAIFFAVMAATVMIAAAGLALCHRRVSSLMGGVR